MYRELGDDSGGRWRVTTLNGSTYLLDLDRRLIQRQPGRGSEATSMRADGWEVNLVEVMQCQVGLPLVVVIDLRLPGVMSTRRIASDITRIRLARTVDPE